MKDSGFLIVTEKGIRGFVKSKTSPNRHAPHKRPALKAGEYAVLISVIVPDSVFKPTPFPTATLEVPESAVVVPVVAVNVEKPPALEEDPDYLAGLNGGTEK